MNTDTPKPLTPRLLGRDADRIARALKVLANPDRLKMLCRMALGDAGASPHPTVGELVDLTGLSQSRVSQHLALLREAGVVTGRRDGQTVRYRLTDGRIRVILERLSALCDDGLPESHLDYALANGHEAGGPG